MDSLKVMNHEGLEMWAKIPTLEENKRKVILYFIFHKYFNAFVLYKINQLLTSKLFGYTFVPMSDKYVI